MKRMLPLAAAAMVGWMMVGCVSRTPSGDTNSLAFDTFVIDTVCPLLDGPETPRCHFQLSIEYPAATVEEALRHEVDEFIAELFFQGDYMGLSACEAAIKYRDTYLAAYMKEGEDVREIYGGDLQAASTWMSYEECSVGRVLYNDGAFLSYGARFETYRGGAHGNTVIFNRVLDLNSGCAVALGDIFDEREIDQVSAVLRETLASLYKCSSVDELGEMQPFFSPKEIEVTDNFYIDSTGITWQYSPYEIAPYVLGVITIPLTWAQVAPYIEEGSPMEAFAAEHK